MSILSILQIVFLISIGAILFLLESIQLIYGIAVAVTFLIIAIQLFEKFKISLLLVWEVAFLYTIALEGFFHHSDILAIYGNSTIPASRYIVLTFFSSIIGYQIGCILDKNNNKSANLANEPKGIVNYNSSVYMLPFLFILYFSFIYSNYSSAVSSLLGGRISIPRSQGNLSFMRDSINNTLSMTLPAILGFVLKYVYKTKKYILKSVLLSMPIFIILFLVGTRFPLLFSVLGLSIILIGGVRIRWKQVLKFTIIGFIFVYITQIMRESRVGGLSNYLVNNGLLMGNDFFKIFYTREGITRAMAMAMDYFSPNSHMYGSSLGFIFIFWIPRILWENKPVMLGYWLIREMQFGGFGPTHNISFGFAGDAYADFGFLGGMIFSVIVGYLIHLLGRKKKKEYIDNYDNLYMAIRYPFVFFAMRSLITASITFIGMTIFLWFFKKTLKKDVYKIKMYE